MSEMMAKIHPFGSVEVCPACGTINANVPKYRDGWLIRTRDGAFMDMRTISDAPHPHLEIHCSECGYGWLEHTKGEVEV